MLKNEPINSTAHALSGRGGGGEEGEGGGMVGSIYGEEAKRQYCKSRGREKKKCVMKEGGGVTERERQMREGRGESESRGEREREVDG